MKLTTFRPTTVLILLFTIPVAPASAQSTGATIAGVVVDQNGSLPIAGARSSSTSAERRLRQLRLMKRALSLLQASRRERTRSSSVDPGFQQRAPTRSTLTLVGPGPCVLRYRGRQLVHQTSLAEHNRCRRSAPLVCRRPRLSRDLSIRPSCKMRTTCVWATVLRHCPGSTCRQREARISATISISISADSGRAKRKRSSTGIPLAHSA